MTSFSSHSVWGSLSEKAALELKREGSTGRETSTPSRGDCLVKVQRTRQRSIPSDKQSGKGTGAYYAKARRHRCDRYEELQVLQLRKGAYGNGERKKDKNTRKMEKEKTRNSFPCVLGTYHVLPDV